MFAFLKELRRSRFTVRATLLRSDTVRLLKRVEQEPKETRDEVHHRLKKLQELLGKELGG